MGAHYACCQVDFFLHILVIVMLVVFAGMMSGLTLGLMSLSVVELEVIAKSGTPKDRIYAVKILPVVRKHHLLLCTLLICNAAAMEALPIFLDSLISELGAILISVTLILVFGEILPQSVCTRYGLAIGANVAPAVRILMWICYPFAFPISKLLDFVLGHEHKALFRRAELKTLVSFYENKAGKGGELTHDETSIIAGALELTEKTVGDVMTPVSSVFAININAKLDRELMSRILDNGHSRVPVYHEQPTDIIGLVLVKNLLTINPEKELPVKSVTIRRIPKVSETMPLYDILNEFQKGHSHMAVVVRKSKKTDERVGTLDHSDSIAREVKVNIDRTKSSIGRSRKSKIRHLKRNLPIGVNSSFGASGGSKRWSKTKDMYTDILSVDGSTLPKVSEEEEVVGIITMEDVIEELLQEEILDEHDHDS